MNDSLGTCKCLEVTHLYALVCQSFFRRLYLVFVPNLLPARLEGCFGGRCKLPLRRQSKTIETPGQVSLLSHALYALFNHHLRSGGSCALQEVPTSVLLWGGTGVLPAADVVFPVVGRKELSHPLRLLRPLTKLGLFGRSTPFTATFFHRSFRVCWCRVPEGRRRCLALIDLMRLHKSR